MSVENVTCNLCGAKIAKRSTGAVYVALDPEFIEKRGLWIRIQVPLQAAGTEFRVVHVPETDVLGNLKGQVQQEQVVNAPAEVDLCKMCVLNSIERAVNFAREKDGQ